ncbi:MAG TPA: LacI family transcriptional regulator [Ectothiorhodospiraceae bacterium]|nr:LacI family transcriptional regulator [Ectothiorhodospiraceae bacterium]
MPKKFIRLVVAVLALLASAPLLSQERGNSQKIYTVGFAQDTMSNDWRAAQVNDVKRVLEKHPNIRFISTDAKGSSARQAFDFERLANDGADILITSPRDVRAMTPVVSEVMKRGIPVVLLSRRIMSDDFTTFIGADDREIAREAGRYLAKELNGKGRVVMLRGVLTATTAIARTEGFIDEMKNHPGIEIVAQPVANYRRNIAIKEMEKVISAGIKFDALYAHSDSMATGARMAMEMAGIDPKSIKIVGIDYIPEARKAIRAGEQSASFTYPTAGAQGAEAVLKIIRGEKMAKEQKIPFTRVTIENVEQVETIFK